MRKILFRGKRTGNGEWIYGYYFFEDTNVFANFNGCHYVHPCGQNQALSVIPKTVGQYTGLTDKNGKKIFEGDIIRHYNRHDETDYFYIGVIEWAEEKYGFANRDIHENRLFLVSDRCIYEVVGNIHDNPELLNK